MNSPVPFSRIALWFLASRLFVLMVAGLSLLIIPPGKFPAHHEFLEWFNHWDAINYLKIVQNGYFYDPQAESTVPFFPLYPVMIHTLGYVIPDPRVTGYLLSNGFLFASCLLLWKLVVRDYGNKAVADRAILFLLFCPMTVFFSSIYTESLFLFLLLAVVYLSGAHRWLAAGEAGFFAALTRPPGILVVVPIGVEYANCFFSGQKKAPRRFSWPEAVQVLAALLLPEIGLGLYAFYLHEKFGDALAFVHAQAYWKRHLVGFWHIFSAGAGFHYHIVWFYGALLVAFILTAFGVVYRLRPSHLGLTFAFLLLYCSTTTLEAIPRFLSVVFPLYIVAAQICVRHPRLEKGFYAASAALAAFAIGEFVDGYWIT